MPESVDVSAGNQAYAADYNALRDDALRMLLAQGIGAAETIIISGALTITSDNIGFVTVGAQTGVEDQLDTMTVASLDDGDVVALMATAGDEITIADSASTDGFSLSGEDIILAGELILLFVHSGTTWYLVGRLMVGNLNFNIGNGISIIANGQFAGVRVPYDMEIIRSSIYAHNESGSIRVEFWEDTTLPLTSADEKGSISLSAARSGEDTTLSGWTDTRFNKDYWVIAYVDGAATTITHVIVELKYIVVVA